MAKNDRTAPADEGSVMLHLLEAVDRESNITQRSLADELGVALGLINAYLKRGVKRGLIKVQQVPKRRFAYYLTPQGLAEKSRLAAEYLSASFEFFRRAKRDCEAVTRVAAERGWNRLVLVGASDLAEIAVICAAESQVRIVGVVDANVLQERFHGVRVWKTIEDVGERADAAVITALDDVRGAYVQSVNAVGRERVLVPALLEPSAADVVRVLPMEPS